MIPVRVFPIPALMAALLSVSTLLSADPGGQTHFWNLEADTIVSIHTASGTRGTCTLKKGTRVEVISDSTDKMTLKFAGESFEMPKGAVLQEALQKLNPTGTPKNKLVFDSRRWMHEKTPEEAETPINSAKGEYSPEDFRTVPDPPTLDTGDKEVPDGFMWDRTIIIPGKFAFLNIPFIKETKAGTCVGASSINVVRYLKPDYLLTNPEHFRLITGSEAGASDRELCEAMKLLGLPAHIESTKIPLPVLLSHLKKSGLFQIGSDSCRNLRKK